MPENTELETITVRKAPRYLPFILLGVLFAVIVAGVLSIVAPGSQEYSRGAAFGYFAMLFSIPGAGLGALTALVLDSLSTRKMRQSDVRRVDPDSSLPSS